MIKAAKEKKARFNVLRIYRRYKNPKECKNNYRRYEIYRQKIFKINWW